MRNYYLTWHKMIERAVNSWGKVSVNFKPRAIAIAGMGGSGCVGDYIEALASSKEGFDSPIIVVKSPSLPKYITSSDLVFAVSYSGDTTETIMAFKEALKRGVKVVTVTSGGMLEEYSKIHGVPIVKVSEGLVPRVALPEMLIGILGVLDSIDLTLASMDEVIRLTQFISEKSLDAVSEAKALANFIYKYSGSLTIATHIPLEVLAIRGKNELNENAKIPVKVEVAPEWAHNDIVGWENPFTMNWAAITIADPSNILGIRLVEFMESIYVKSGVKVWRLILKGSSLLEKLIYGSLVLGLASVELAELRGLNPLETKSIALYKKFLREITEEKPC